MRKISMTARLLAVLLYGLLLTPATGNTAEATVIKVTLTAGEHTLAATFEDNATSRALVARFPLTVPMRDLYDRELCYAFPDPLPADEARTSGYEVGDVVYWTPGRSLVIMYEQNGERISSLQKIGRVHSGVEVFKHTGDIEVTFTLDGS